ncbi:alpha-ketoacid dehydrogenase subunit beta [Parasphingorhabdus sp.]|uniref:alpha-ketoacid dehydrogenase subunit beta n=1 Tax=Parasphingorhabdus sp. TaxID=2709688 RepID=UPI003A91B982
MTERKSRKLTIAKSMAEALGEAMDADERVFVMGEDIGKLGGAFGNTAGLYDRFGGTRVRDTPISETGFIGAAVGAAACGMRPVVELMFVDFFGVCMDAIYNLAAKNAYFSGGNQPIPMVIMSAIGGGYGDAGQHSQTLYGTFAHLPGMKVVAPSNAYDAKGLMHAAIKDDNPVIYLFHKALHGLAWLGTTPDSITHTPTDAYEVPIGKAAVLREGTDVTIVGLSWPVHLALAAAEDLAGEGVSAEVIDLRSLVPLDKECILNSVRKTGRLVVVDDDYQSFGVTGEIIALVSSEAFGWLKSAPQRVAHPDIPIPFARPMEQFALPSKDKIIASVRATLST